MLFSVVTATSYILSEKTKRRCIFHFIYFSLGAVFLVLFYFEKVYLTFFLLTTLMRAIMSGGENN